MVEDAFERALRREQELRERLAAGEIDDDELEAMRGFEHAARTTDLRLSIDQARRLVDEGADPAVVAVVVSNFPRVSIDQAIDVVVEYGVEIDSVRAFVTAGIADGIDGAALTEVFENDLSAEFLDLVAAVTGDSRAVVTTALDLAHCVCDPADALDALKRAGLTGLTVDQIATIADYEINPEVVRRLLDGDPELTVDGALRLLLNEDPPGRRNGRVSIGWTLDEAAVERSVAAMKVGAAVARDVARFVVAGFKGKST